MGKTRKLAMVILRSYSSARKQKRRKNERKGEERRQGEGKWRQKEQAVRASEIPLLTTKTLYKLILAYAP